jgi:hypothetical protein
MKGSRQRERLLVRAARRIDDGAPPRAVCRDLGVTAADIAAWRWERAPEVLRLAGKVSDLEWENRRLRSVVGDLRHHRQMLLDAFNLVFPAPATRPEQIANNDDISIARRRTRARDKYLAWIM